MNYAFKVHVAERHIINGLIQECRKCPIALAVLEFFEPVRASLKGELIVSVGVTGVVSVHIGDKLFRFRAPWAARFITRFDTCQHVAPQTLYFEAV